MKKRKVHTHTHTKQGQLSEDSNTFFSCVVLKPVPQAPTSRGRRRSKGVPMGTQTKHDADVCGRRNVRNMEKVHSTLYMYMCMLTLVT